MQKNSPVWLKEIQEVAYRKKEIEDLPQSEQGALESYTHDQTCMWVVVHKPSILEKIKESHMNKFAHKYHSKNIQKKKKLITIHSERKLKF